LIFYREITINFCWFSKLAFVANSLFLSGGIISMHLGRAPRCYCCCGLCVFCYCFFGFCFRHLFVCHNNFGWALA